MQIDEQVAIVTGGASGLGEATARLLAALGANVAILDRDGDRAADIAAQIGGYSQACDITDEQAVATGVTSTMARFGEPARIIINCAGIGVAARIVGREGQVSTDLFRRVIDVNLMGTYYVMTYAAQALMGAPPLVPDGARGVIINTASIAFQDGQIGQAAYAASKGGIASLTLPAAREFARLGIRVMAIAPGLFETAMSAGLPPEVKQSLEAGLPFPARMGHPEEYALLVEQVIRNPILNGEVIRLDSAVRLPPK